MSEDPTAAFQPAFWAAKRVLAHASATAFARHGVHEGQQYILARLWAEDGLSPGELARGLGLSTPTVTRAATRMARPACCAARRTSATAAVRLFLTDRGRALEKVIGREIDELNERALASLDEPERATLVRLLGSISRDLAATPEPPR